MNKLWAEKLFVLNFEPYMNVSVDETGMKMFLIKRSFEIWALKAFHEVIISVFYDEIMTKQFHEPIFDEIPVVPITHLTRVTY